MKVVIKSNNTVVKEVCPICNRWHKDADIPYWLFPVNGPMKAVCLPCACELFPTLLEKTDRLNDQYQMEDKEA
mgnify:CR=1 FL=1